MKPIEHSAFLALRKGIESHTRLCGYYLIKLVDISDSRAAGHDDEEIAEEVFQHFDDHAWPSMPQRPNDQSWADYVTARTKARAQTVEFLVGGPPVGHLEVTMNEQQAGEYFDRFDGLFSEPKTYYVGLGLGDPEYVFSGGVAIISSDLAGCLWIVESD